MRIAPLILWVLGSILWLPWFLLFVRLLIDLAFGTALADSAYLGPVFISMAPRFGWLDWRLNSWTPICALLGCASSAAAWRVTWILRDALLRHTAFQVGLSIAVPPLALYFAWHTLWLEHQEKNARLTDAARAAGGRLTR